MSIEFTGFNISWLPSRIGDDILIKPELSSIVLLCSELHHLNYLWKYPAELFRWSLLQNASPTHNLHSYTDCYHVILRVSETLCLWNPKNKSSSTIKVRRSHRKRNDSIVIYSTHITKIYGKPPRSFYAQYIGLRPGLKYEVFME